MSTGVDITAPGKLIAICIVLVGCLSYIIATLFVEGVDTTPAWATITLVTGYLIGNGTGARRGIITHPIFAPRHEELAEAPTPVLAEEVRHRVEAADGDD